MPGFLDEVQLEILSAACNRMIPPDGGVGPWEVGVVEYIQGLLTAFDYDPPRIWAGGGFSGRFGGPSQFGQFVRLTEHEELAWRTRIEGSLGLPGRERLGPVVGLQEHYTKGLADLGDDFPALPPDLQDGRLRDLPAFTALLYGHVCEGMYSAPEYGGNRDQLGWQSIGYLGDVQPRGYTDDEVSRP